MLNRYFIINLFLALWLGFVSYTSIAKTHIQQPKIIVSIAVQSFLGTSVANTKWQPTVDFLNEKLPSHHFELLIIEAQNVKLLRQLVAEGKLDYVITQPVTTAELEYLSDIIPVLTKIDKLKVSQFGSVIIVSALNTKINSLEDLKGKTFAGANPTGLGGWILGYDYLLSKGINPYNDFSRIDFLGRQDSIVDAVNKGMMDAGLIRTGVLEKLQESGKIELSNIKVLDYKPDFPYILSTHLVPEWSFSATTAADPQLTTLIQKKLLLHKTHIDDIEVDGSVSVRKHKYHKIAKWGDVADYKVIHQLLRKHKLSVYSDNIVIIFLKKYYQFFLFLLVMMIASFWYIKDKRSKRIKKYKIELERLSRVRSVDQLLSEIAHEIAQPVTSIKIDVKVIEKLLKKTDTISDDSINKVVNSLGQKTDYCVDVINNIRSFLSTKEITYEVVNVNDQITHVLELINHEISLNKVKVIQSLEEELPLVYMSVVEFDQVMLNLCKNAISAMSDGQRKHKTIIISTAIVDNNVIVTVKDNGPGIVDEENLFKLFKTNKSLNSTEGLGLGLSLSRSIIRSYDGNLILESSSSQGATFIVTIPKINEK